mmetsp:Transcript_174537/g.559558  ORF Transcript_174537/g.559558 Transcript_174537/m.559558 type:complete len:241 (-) Transcript_174537:262-984(-)
MPALPTADATSIHNPIQGPSEAPMLGRDPSFHEYHGSNCSLTPAATRSTVMYWKDVAANEMNSPRGMIDSLGLRTSPVQVEIASQPRGPTQRHPLTFKVPEDGVYQFTHVQRPSRNCLEPYFRIHQSRTISDKRGHREGRAEAKHYQEAWDEVKRDECGQTHDCSHAHPPTPHLKPPSARAARQLHDGVAKQDRIDCSIRHPADPLPIHLLHAPKIAQGLSHPNGVATISRQRTTELRGE